MNQVSSIQTYVCNFKYNFTDAKVTSNGDISFAAYLAKANGLVGLLESLNGTLNEAPARCDEGTDFLVAHIFAGYERSSLVGLGRCYSRFSVPSADGFRRDIVFVSNG